MSKIIIKFSGGLGNQMFQYAFYLGYIEKCNRDIKFDVDTHYSTNKIWGFDLDRLFLLNISNNKATSDEVRKLAEKKAHIINIMNLHIMIKSTQ